MQRLIEDLPSYYCKSLLPLTPEGTFEAINHFRKFNVFDESILRHLFGIILNVKLSPGLPNGNQVCAHMYLQDYEDLDNFHDNVIIEISKHNTYADIFLLINYVYTLYTEKTYPYSFLLKCILYYLDNKLKRMHTLSQYLKAEKLVCITENIDSLCEYLLDKNFSYSEICNCLLTYILNNHSFFFEIDELQKSIEQPLLCPNNYIYLLNRKYDSENYNKTIDFIKYNKA